MIVNHRYRFVFIKTRKTGSSSVEVALSRACDEGDIVTPLEVELGEEEVRLTEGGRGPYNWAKPVREYRTWREWRRRLKGKREPRFIGHATVHQVADYLGPAWPHYYSFAVERNPWDRAVSRYWWEKWRWESRKKSSFPPLSDYLQWLEAEKRYYLTHWDHYADEERILVNHVVRYERLSEGVQAVAQHLGIREDMTLPRLKSRYRKDRRHYREVLSDADAELIARVCAREIAAFGYRF